MMAFDSELDTLKEPVYAVRNEIASSSAAQAAGSIEELETSSFECGWRMQLTRFAPG